MMDSASYPSPEFLADNVMLMVLNSMYKRKHGTMRLAKFEATSKKASRLVRVHYSTKVKKLVIEESNEDSSSIAINKCIISKIRYSSNGHSEAAGGLKVFRQCLTYILFRITLITRLIAKASHRYKFPPLKAIALDLEKCLKLRLKTLHITGHWSSLLINLIPKHSATLRNLKTSRDASKSHKLEALTFNLKKFDLNLFYLGASIKGLVWAMIEGGSRAESVKISTYRGFNSIRVKNKGDIYSQLVQQLSPKSLIWNSFYWKHEERGTIYCGNILEKDSWLEATLNYEIIQDNLHILDLKQANMRYCTWGESPFTMSRMKKCFPNLQELRLSWIALYCPLEKEIENVHKLIIDLFKTWPELDAIVKFQFMNLEKDAAEVKFTEEDMALVENEPNYLRSTLPNLALVRTCVRSHHHLQPILEIVSTGKARAILKFLANRFYPEDEIPLVGYHGTNVYIRREDECTLEENNSFIVVCEAV